MQSSCLFVVLKYDICVLCTVYSYESIEEYGFECLIRF